MVSVLATVKEIFKKQVLQETYILRDIYTNREKNNMGKRQIGITKKRWR